MGRTPQRTPFGPRKHGANGGYLRPRVWVALLVLLDFGLAPSGCLYDPDDTCDPGEREVDYVCVCEEGLVRAEVGCEPCGDHASAMAGTCVCDDGFARTDPEGPCEEVSADLGQTCDPSAADPGCPESFPYCQTSDFDGGYCTTSGCTTDADCAGAYVCDTRISPSVCVRLPVGMGMACESDADCEGTEATYCVTAQGAGCAVQGCTLPDVGCPPAHVCCDLTSFGLTLLCAPEDQCPT